MEQDEREVFNETEFIERFLDVDLEEEGVFEDFIQILGSNLDFIARMNATDSGSFFDSLPRGAWQLVRVSFAESVLDFHDLGEQYKIKNLNKSNELSFNYDIITFANLQLATPKQIKSYNFSKNFSKKPGFSKQKKSINQNHQPVINELANLSIKRK